MAGLSYPITYKLKKRIRIRKQNTINDMKLSNLVILLLLLISFSCKQHSESVKHYDALDNIRNVKENIHEITIENIAISNFGTPSILNDYLIISDYKSFDKLIHIFDKNTFAYRTSVGDRGQGPSEIANMGSIIPDEKIILSTFSIMDISYYTITPWIVFFQIRPIYPGKKQT